MCGPNFCVPFLSFLYLWLGMMNRVSQMPVVLIPIHFDRKAEDRPLIPSCQYSIVLRPFITSDFMTGVAAVPGVDLPESVSTSIVIGFRP